MYCDSRLNFKHLGPLGRQVLRELDAESESCVEHMLPPSSLFRKEEVPPGHFNKNERSGSAVVNIFTDGAAIVPQSEVLRINLRMAWWAAVFDIDNG
eukprot:4650574-Amphidinium_carterae.5